MAAIDSSPEFIARATEMAALGDGLSHAGRGEPAVIVIGGEVGVGKTRLLDEFARQSRDRALVLIGRCFPSSGARLPYAPFADLYRDLERQLSPRELARILGPARNELALLVPELDAGPRRPEADDTGEARLVGRARFFELLLGIGYRLQARRPAVIAIDDLQWADAGSLDLLGFLARGIRDGRFLLVLVVRTDDLPRGHRVLAAIGDIERTGRVRRLEVPRFTRSELAEQMAAILGTPPDPDLVDRVLARSDGNPFFAEELLASVRRGEDTDIPPMLTDLLRARLAAVSDSTTAVLRVAALVGTEIDDELVVAASGIPAEQVATGLREAAEHGLIIHAERGRSSLVFRHRLVQESIAGDLLPGERRRLHAACAEALERLPRPRLVAGEAARHWLLAGRPERALPATIIAGLEAERRFAFGDARLHLEEALRLAEVTAPSGDWDLDLVGILEHAADDAAFAGDAPAAVAFARRALVALGGSEDRSREASIHDRLRWYLWVSGDLEGAARAIEDAYRLVPADPPSATRARVLGHFGGLRLRQGRLAESSAYADEAVAVARACAALPDLAFALGVRGWVRATLGRPDDGLGDLREALTMAELLERPEGVALGTANLASLLVYAGRLEGASRTALEGLETVRSIGLERTYGASLLATAAAAAYLLGRWDQARSLLARALAMGPPGPEPAWPGVVAMRLAASSGDEGLMRAGRAACEPFLLAVTDRIHGEWYRLASIEADLWAGRADRACEAASAAVQALPSPVLDEPAGAAFALAIRAAADLAEMARMMRDELGLAAHREAAAGFLGEWRRRREAAAGRVPDPGMVAALDSLCEAEAGRAAAVDDPARWSDAARAFERAGIDFAAGYALYRQAEASLTGGPGRGHASVRARRAAAAIPLREALRLAERMGARPLAASAARLASRARLDLAPREALEAPAAALSSARRGAAAAASFVAERRLTPRELEILILVGSGWSNGEIARALFISRKTASVHVSNLLGKLGVADRIEAASIAQRAGLDASPPPGSVLAELVPDA